MTREILEKIIRKIRAYDNKEDGHRLVDWFLHGDIPKMESIDDALEADYRRKPELWQDPSIVLLRQGPN